MAQAAKPARDFKAHAPACAGHDGGACCPQGVSRSVGAGRLASAAVSIAPRGAVIHGGHGLTGICFFDPGHCRNQELSQHQQKPPKDVLRTAG